MTGPDSYTAWLGGRSDAQLVALLDRRPDLAVPLPSSMAVLAARAQQRASVLRTADDLDTTAFGIVETLAVHTAAGNEPMTRAELKRALRGRAKAASVDAALTDLTDRALVWFTDDGIGLVPAAAEAVPWPLGSGLDPNGSLSEQEIVAALPELPDAERALLDTLAETGPRGRTRDAATDAPTDRPVPRLLARGLLRRIDHETVELPSAVGALLRGEPVTDTFRLAPPESVAAAHTVDEVNGVGAGEVGELLRHCATLLEVLGQAPAPALRAGGLGVRELRRIAKAAGIDEARGALLVELLAAAKLIEKGFPDPPPDADADDFWAPTPAADSWLEAAPARRWLPLAHGWLELDRYPWMIGLRDTADKPLAALAHELRAPTAVGDRRAVLGALAEQHPGTALYSGDIGRLLAWRTPRRRRRYRSVVVDNTLGEAAALGLTGRGALTASGRALLTATPADAEAELEAALPDPIDHVLVQADLTVVAPGPLTAELQQRIELVADVESAGAATVYRLSEPSLRRALDAGLTAAELHSLFDRHSRTPVPQTLTYLIDDVARRHGRLRAGMAQSFVRSEDPTLLAQVLASPVASTLALRGLAPTVAISQAPLGELFDELRTAGFAPTGEDASGAIVDLRQRGARINVRPLARQSYRPSPPTIEQLEKLVTELRAGERAAGATAGQAVRSDGSRTGTAATLALLQLAARVHRQVHIGYVDAQGIAIQRVVEPVRVGNGQLEALDPVTGSARQFTLHRISSVALLD